MTNDERRTTNDPKRDSRIDLDGLLLPDGNSGRMGKRGGSWLKKGEVGVFTSTYIGPSCLFFFFSLVLFRYNLFQEVTIMTFGFRLFVLILPSLSPPLLTFS